MKLNVRHATLIILSAGLFWFGGCSKDPAIVDPEPPDPGPPATTPYTLDIPAHFPPMDIPADNPMTVEGVALGRKLFYDPILSGDNTQSCASCHNIQDAFTDNGLQFSVGIEGNEGTRNAMALVNLGWADEMFWDGRSPNMEEQVLHPVPDPLEMNLSWSTALEKLNSDSEYPDLFWAAFGTRAIDSLLVAKAIAQFERTLISGNSRLDQWAMESGDTLELLNYLTLQEKVGFELFQTTGFGCAHCHGTILFSDHDFHDNGLFEEPFDDAGLSNVTGDSFDAGKFKAPTLRNIELTAPYMHDGSIPTLEEVLDRYANGMNENSNFDPVFELHYLPSEGGLGMDAGQKAALIAFLKTLTDTAFISNPAFMDPEP